MIYLNQFGVKTNVESNNFAGREKNKGKSLIIFMICYTAYTFIYMARVNLSIAASPLEDMQILDKAQIGLMGSAFFIMFSIGRIINGTLGDRIKPSILITVGLIAVGISNFAIGLLPPAICMTVLWGINAYAQSMLWGAMLCVMSDTYEEKKAKRYTTYLVTSTAAGNIIGIIVSMYVITNFGIGYAFFVPAGLTIAASILTACFVKTSAVCDCTKAPVPIYKLILNRDIRNMLLPAMAHGAIKDNISLWMAIYFVDKYSIDLAKTAGFVFFIPAVGFVGRMIYQPIYKICGENEHIVSAVSFCACAVAALPLCFNIAPIPALICLCVLSALISVINTSMLSIYPLRFIKTGNVSSASGIMDFATYMGAGIGSVIYGIILKNGGYTNMFISWIAISVISFMILIKKEKQNV